MKFLSVFSGIEAASVAWEPLGWEAIGFSEIAPFPCSVLAHHFPQVPNFGDITRHESWNIDPGTVDIVVGGSPCQSFSNAGKRAGLNDPRGQLMFAYLGVVRRFRPRWVVWENVPGVLSSRGGRDFGSFVGNLAQLGYGWAYRVLDAQWCRVDGFPKAVPQRRRRVFLVGCLRDARRAGQVLFERESVQRDPSARQKAGKKNTLLAEGSVTPEVSGTVTSKWATGSGGPSGNETSNLVLWNGDDAARGLYGFSSIGAALDATFDKSPTVRFKAPPAIAHRLRAEFDVARLSVRRLTPRECERLQGFPDDWTLVPHRNKPAADGPRYKAIGNSMAVNCMRWIGRRIEAVEAEMHPLTNPKT